MNKNADNRNLRRQRQKSRSHQIISFISGVCVLLTIIGLLLWGREILTPNVSNSPAPYPKEAIDEEIIDEEVIDEAEWSLILVNKWNPIPAEYNVELTWLSNGEAVDARIYPALQKMFDEAKAAGVYPVVASGYRTVEKQQEIMDEKIAAFKAKGYPTEQAQKEAETWVAIPGTSEHQLGIAVDINGDGIHSTGNEIYEWLDENGHHFGFIRRYPPDKTQVTGVSNEPWHYRYVGVKAATEIHNQGICLEEYLDKTN